MRYLIQIMLGAFLAVPCARRASLLRPLTSGRGASPEDPRISPDGQRVVYVERWNDRAGRAVCSNLWLVSVDGRERRRFGAPSGPSAWRDRSPRWSPTSDRIAWLSDRSGKTDFTLPAPAGGEAAELETR